MSKSIVTITIEALAAAGLRAFEAYPGTTAPVLTGPAVAVSLDGVDNSEKTVKVRLLVMVPASMGGSGCRVAAVKALGVLERSGAKGTLEGCEYGRKSCLMSMAVVGIFQGTEKETGFTEYTQPEE